MRAFLRLTCLLLLVLSLANISSAEARAGRTLKVVSLSSGLVGVQGTGWGHKRVTVSLATGQWLVSLTVRPALSGSFRIAAEGANLCAGVAFHAYGPHGGSKTAKGPDLKCAVPANLPRPTLHVVAGKSVQPPTVRIIAQHPPSVTLHVGEILYLLEPGTDIPAFNPSVLGSDSTTTGASDVGRLALIDRGITSATACQQVDCAAGFYWKWIAVAPGDTGIVLSAACRQSKPPCMVPDFLITVHIIP